MFSVDIFFCYIIYLFVLLLDFLCTGHVFSMLYKVTILLYKGKITFPCYIRFYSTVHYVNEFNNLESVLGLIYKSPVLPDLWYLASLSPVLHCQQCLLQWKNLYES